MKNLSHEESETAARSDIWKYRSKTRKYNPEKYQDEASLFPTEPCNCYQPHKIKISCGIAAFCGENKQGCWLWRLYTTAQYARPQARFCGADETLNMQLKGICDYAAAKLEPSCPLWAEQELETAELWAEGYLQPLPDIN